MKTHRLLRPLLTDYSQIDSTVIPGRSASIADILRRVQAGQSLDGLTRTPLESASSARELDIEDDYLDPTKEKDFDEIDAFEIREDIDSRLPKGFWEKAKKPKTPKNNKK